MLKRVCREAKAKKKVTDAHLTQLYAEFGSRFAKAREVMNEGRTKKYIFRPSGRIVWIVVGKQQDYLIMPAADFCPCDDFYFRVMDKKVHLCYHLIAQKLAEAVEAYDLVEENDYLYDSLMKEWKKVTP